MAYTAIPKTLSGDWLTVQQDMESGFPSTFATRESVLPKLVEMVKEYQDRLLKGVDVSVHTDAGSGDMYHGIRVLPWIFTSPLLPFDIVAHIDLLPVHETGEIQADLLDRLVVSRSLDPRLLKWLGVDNAQLNIKTARLLRKRGYAITVARCIDHCLNLIFVAFLGPFETRFSMQKLLRSIRAYIKSGGGAVTPCNTV